MVTGLCQDGNWLITMVIWAQASALPQTFWMIKDCTGKDYEVR